MPQKQRLDTLLFERDFAPSREKARAMIMAGEVRVAGQIMDKPGMKVASDVEIEVKNKPRFVSRGGEKLMGALMDFKLDVRGCICADVGASTGGFTDCLLQHGAARVYAIDVGYGQLAHPLRQDNRVIVIERTNARYLQKLDEQVDLVVVDASFISLKLLLPTVKNWLKQKAFIIPLIKPQFEAGKKAVGKGGVVRDHAVHQHVLNQILTFAVEEGFHINNLTRSPIKGPAGNIEFLALLEWDTESATVIDNVEDLISSLQLSG